MIPHLETRLSGIPAAIEHSQNGFTSGGAVPDEHCRQYEIYVDDADCRLYELDMGRGMVRPRLKEHPT